MACLGRGYIIGLVGVVMIDGTSRKADIAVLIPSTALSNEGHKMTAALLLSALLSGLLPSNGPAQAFSAPADQWLSYDAGTNTVTFELIAGPFTFNGYRDGGATLLVPSKAKTVINFVNKDGTPHSAIVIAGDGSIPNSPTDPAIPRAYTNKALEGLPQEATDVMSFPVPENGAYRIVCGVPGHGLSGMRIWLKVDPAVKRPTFGSTKA